MTTARKICWKLQKNLSVFLNAFPITLHLNPFSFVTVIRHLIRRNYHLEEKFQLPIMEAYETVDIS